MTDEFVGLKLGSSSRADYIAFVREQREFILSTKNRNAANLVVVSRGGVRGRDKLAHVCVGSAVSG